MQVFVNRALDNDEWTVARRYMSLETLARISDTANARLPAVAV